jgi:hypothetical protein
MQLEENKVIVDQLKREKEIIEKEKERKKREEEQQKRAIVQGFTKIKRNIKVAVDEVMIPGTTSFRSATLAYNLNTSGDEEEAANGS